jgi:hypothetical protein
MYKFHFVLHREHIVLLSERTVCERCVGMWSLFVVRILRKTYMYCVRQFRGLLLLELRPRIDASEVLRMIGEWIWSIVEMITGTELLKYSGNSHRSAISSTTNPKGTGCMWSLTSQKNYYHLHFVACFVFPWHFSPWTIGELQAQASSFRLQYFPYYVWCSR